MLWNNVKYAVWQNAVGELYASLHPAQWALERTHRGGCGSPSDLLGGIALPFNLQLQQPTVTSQTANYPAVSVSSVLSWPPGFRLNEEVQHSIVTRYACSTQLSIDFDGFVACMIRLETLFSECPGAAPQSFGAALGVLSLSAASANCMERSGCQQNRIRESSRETAKAFLSEWPWGAGDMFPEQTRECFHNTPVPCALQSPATYGQCSGPHIVPALTNGTIYHLQSLLRPDLQVCPQTMPDATTSDFIVVLLPTPILLLLIYSTPWSSLEIICKKKEEKL